ncbi:dipeptide ABC transporter ATP-binding protein [Nocardioides mangrovicus]|uniref:dipeptide ABC transporter ATP-binding protein n=1 Tax=Nocardioides mangrovicus TaxID=2478913 RepID=UPI001314DD33|nr:ABC transporter ATP-binding protein [Nocardioides mangrovicus]
MSDLSVRYDSGTSSRLALDRVSLEIGAGEILGIVGESGSGKSTLTSAITGLLPANGQVVGGCIRLQGRDLGALDPDELRSVRGSQVAVVFQDPTTSLNPRLPVGAQLEQVLDAHGAARGADRTSLLASRLAEVGLADPERALTRYPHEFSGGMRQRVMIAMALLLEPALVIADEATSALDLTLEAQILELLLRLRDERGTSLMFISHDLGVVSQLCDRVAVMYAGRVIEETSGTAVLASPAHPYTQALDAATPTASSQRRRLASVPGRMPDLTAPATSCSFAPRCLHAAEVCETLSPELLTTSTGRARCLVYDPEHQSTWKREPVVADWQPTEAAAEPRGPAVSSEEPPLVLVDDLAVHFGGTRGRWRRHRTTIRAVDGVSLRVHRGQILGVVGESGSGKTTLGQAMVDLLRPTRGSVVFDGTATSSLSGAARRGFRRRVQMIFQDAYASLSPRMRVSEQVTEPYLIHRVPGSERRSAEELLASVNLPASVARLVPSALSGGQARRVGVARALAGGPDLIVADEPTSGLDQSAASAVLNLLTDLRDRTGVSVVLISHSLPQVKAVADAICVMYFGQVVEQGPVDVVTRDPGHPYTQALLALAPDREPGRRLARRRLLVAGEVPSWGDPPTGCRFHPRCAFARDVCRTTTPPQVQLSDAGHTAACHFADLVAAGQLEPTRPAPVAAGTAATP